MRLPISVILIGPSACGKGTQAKRLVGSRGFNHFECGAILRERRRWDEAFDEKAKKMDSGHFLPDEDVIQTMERYLGFIDMGSGNVFDGVVRSVGQAKWLLDFLLRQKHLCLVVFFEFSKAYSIRRMTERYDEAINNGLDVRDDDGDPDSRERRVEQYFDEAKRIEEFIRERYGDAVDILHVQGIDSVNRIHDQIRDCLPHPKKVQPQFSLLEAGH